MSPPIFEPGFDVLLTHDNKAARDMPPLKAAYND
jgi:hypothetical protein